MEVLGKGTGWFGRYIGRELDMEKGRRMGRPNQQGGPIVTASVKWGMLILLSHFVRIICLCFSVLCKMGLPLAFTLYQSHCNFMTSVIDRFVVRTGGGEVADG